MLGEKFNYSFEVGLKQVFIVGSRGVLQLGGQYCDKIYANLVILEPLSRIISV